MTSPVDPAKDVWVTTGADPDLAKERASTWLSVLAMLAISTGITLGLWIEAGWGPWSLCGGGLVLACMISYSDHARRPRDPEPAEPAERKPVPGPTDPGNMHAKGPGAGR